MKISKNGTYWLIQFIGWYGFFTFTELVINTDNAKEGHFIFLLFNPPLGILFTHIYRKRLNRFLVNSSKDDLPLRYIIFGWFLCTLLFWLINFTIFSILLSAKGQSIPSNEYVILTWISFLLSTPWFLVYHTYKFSQLAIQRGIQKAQLEFLLQGAELENLKNQLNPHFLFNALNSIKALTISNPNLAREAITKLSDLLRVSLNYDKADLVTINQEMMLVADYLALEKIRFDKRLNYYFDIGDDVNSLLIPPMLIQTLAENSIKHGISQRKTGGDIFISIRFQRPELFIEVRNSGTLQLGKKGIGLENLKRRLASNGFQGSLTIENLPGEKVSATIKITLHE